MPSHPPLLPLPPPAVLAVGSRYNKSHAAMCLKLGGTVVLVFILWDLKPVFYAMWSPFMALVGYDDPRRPTEDHLHGEG